MLKNNALSKVLPEDSFPALKVNIVNTILLFFHLKVLQFGTNEVTGRLKRSIGTQNDMTWKAPRKVGNLKRKENTWAENKYWYDFDIENVYYPYQWKLIFIHENKNYL